MSAPYSYYHYCDNCDRSLPEGKFCAECKTFFCRSCMEGELINCSECKESICKACSIHFPSDPPICSDCYKDMQKAEPEPVEAKDESL